MVKIQEVWPQLKSVEGGYKASASDPGDFNSRGELVGTNMGVSALTYERIIGKPPTVADMKAIPESVAQMVADEMYFRPNKLNVLASASVASILFGAIYHRPAYGTYILGEALNRLGESLQTTKGDDFKPIKRATLKSEWVITLNYHIKRVGEAAAHNAVWRTLKEYYEKNGESNQVANRLMKPGTYELMPELCTVDYRMNFTGAQEDDPTCYDKQSIPFFAKAKAKSQGWLEDITSIRYANTNPQVWPDFWRALAMLLGVILLCYLGYHLFTKKQPST